LYDEFPGCSCGSQDVRHHSEQQNPTPSNPGTRDKNVGPGVVTLGELIGAHVFQLDFRVLACVRKLVPLVLKPLEHHEQPDADRSDIDECGKGIAENRKEPNSDQCNGKGHKNDDRLHCMEPNEFVVFLDQQEDYRAAPGKNVSEQPSDVLCDPEGGFARIYSTG
jgi:hypothetical protein